ncbi:Gfo/Idh/MocA family oxidoreductase [Alkalihalobacillus sp. MEB130]|uniref:Gfo/Idh/MocA family protein n=1 Tax=Alkalihalobacillus sp. MEB130 TaxID=2976704 RepID=UPI0028DE5BAE|nr:Gfo/Idh/MocA family oxidoreductase [Alkalihalobacillus sp. MEB130]MDT8860797.1 Gfo/Idh/MocA family oxidoreductase [Alkalihalobacillus sp. MEB130]
MEKIRVGVIGCGSIAQKRHLLEYAGNDLVEIIAVCDINEQRAIDVAAQYGVRAYTDYKELLVNKEIEAISVCLPNYLHAEVSIAALNSGKHVLCEKPMATSKEGAEAMIAAARDNGKKLMIAHNQRFVSSHEKAKKLIESGEIGKVYSFRTTFGHGGPEGWSIDGKESWFFRKEEAFIGAMGDLGVHKSDLIRYILGKEVVEVGAMVETNAKEDSSVDDNAVCILKLEDGIIGTLTASWAYSPQSDNSTIIYGEEGIIRLEDDPDYSLILQKKNGETVKYELAKIQSNEEGGQTKTHVIDNFIDCIVNDTPSPVSGEEGFKSLAVILAALESRETKTIVDLKQKLEQVKL